MPFSFSSSISFSSSVTYNGKTEEKRWARKHESGPSGTTIRTASMRTGQPVYLERRDYDASGRPIPQGRNLRSGESANAHIDRRIEDVTEQEQGKKYTATSTKEVARLMGISRSDTWKWRTYQIVGQRIMLWLN
ncbi:hypothetical protein LX36DRAFT_748336 [Colletotrichum falcatum]|nr:hypothetical protein LX36DRAFT_748336 [Colletotrichum falcatum]